MSDLVQAIGTVAGKQAAISRLGVVTAIDEGAKSLTVDINPGNPNEPILLTGIRWFDTYTPQVDDFVGLIAIGSGWWVLGRNSLDLRERPRAYGEATVTAGRMWECEAIERDSIYSWSQIGSTGQSRVGLWTEVPGMPSMYKHFYTAVELPRPTDIPSGATIESGYLTVSAALGLNWEPFTGLDVGAHSYSALPSGPPSWWADDSADMYIEAQPRYYQVPINSDIALGLAAGTAKGVLLSPWYTYALAHVSGIQATITYSVPI